MQPREFPISGIWSKKYPDLHFFNKEVIKYTPSFRKNIYEIYSGRP